MDIDTHLKQAEQRNRKGFGSNHFMLLSMLFSVIVLALIIFLEPLFAVACSGLIAFFLLFAYGAYTYKKLNDRITLLQTKLEQVERK
ncbi:MAG: hypothetical protein ACPGR2_04085 [Psychrobium sp.]